MYTINWKSLLVTFYGQFSAKFLKKNKETKQNEARAENFDICFSVISERQDQIFISGE